MAAIDFLNALTPFVQGAEKERRRQKQEAEQERRRQLAESMQLLQLASQPGVVIPGVNTPEGGFRGEKAPVERRVPFELSVDGGSPDVTSERFERAPQPDMLDLGGQEAPEPMGPPRRRVPESAGRVGDVELAGRDLELFFDPTRTESAIEARREAVERQRERAQQVQAFDLLRQAEPDTYNQFVPGVDYLEELDELAEERRERRTDKLTFEREQRADQREAAREAARDRRRVQSRNRAFDLFMAGKEWEDVRGRVDSEVIPDDDLADIRRSAQRVKADQPEGRRREAIVNTYGAPTTPLEQDIVDQLAEGKTEQQVLQMLKEAGQPQQAIDAAQLYMKGDENRLGQADRLMDLFGVDGG